MRTSIILTRKRFNASTKVITAPHTRDLLRWTRLRDITELRWDERKTIAHSLGEIDIIAVRLKHWGARLQRDDYRGYNGYLIERNGRRILFSGDTAFTETFGELRESGLIDLAIFSIAAYNPWIRSHCTPEQAIEMANAAGAQFIMPVHHQTFRLSLEPFCEPIERFQSALHWCQGASSRRPRLRARDPVPTPRPRARAALCLLWR